MTLTQAQINQINALLLGPHATPLAAKQAAEQAKTILVGAGFSEEMALAIFGV